MLSVFLEVVLPVALVAIVGGIVGRWRQLSGAAIASIVFYLFSPALVFVSLSTTELSAAVSLKIILVMLAVYAIVYVASNVWSTFRSHDRPMRAGFALGATTPNSGNMGLPVAQLAFGDAGLQVAVVNFVGGSVMAYSLGIVVASMAGGSARQALRAPFRFPVVYAAAAAIAVNVFNIDLPVSVETPLESMARAAVPCMLVVLGLQLQQAVSTEFIADTLAANVMRLVLAPLAAVLACMVLGLQGVNRDALIVLTAMPTAVIATIIATEFHAQPAFVTRTVVTTTIASMLSLSLLIALVK